METKKKYALVILFLLIIVLPFVALSIAAYIKHGSLKEGKADFFQQMQGVNDFATLVYKGEGICDDSREKKKVIISNINIKDPENNNLGKFIPSPENIQSIVEWECDNLSDDGAVPLVLKTFFSLQAKEYITGIIYNMEYLSQSGEKILSREAYGVSGNFSYKKGDIIPVSIYVGTGRPIHSIPYSLNIQLVHIDRTPAEEIWDTKINLKSLYSNRDFQNIESVQNVFNSYNNSEIKARERNFLKGEWTYESYSGSALDPVAVG